MMSVIAKSLSVCCISGNDVRIQSPLHRSDTHPTGSSTSCTPKYTYTYDVWVAFDLISALVMRQCCIISNDHHHWQLLYKKGTATGQRHSISLHTLHWRRQVFKADNKPPSANIDFLVCIYCFFSISLQLQTLTTHYCHCRLQLESLYPPICIPPTCKHHCWCKSSASFARRYSIYIY